MYNDIIHWQTYRLSNRPQWLSKTLSDPSLYSELRLRLVLYGQYLIAISKGKSTTLLQRKHKQHHNYSHTCTELYISQSLVPNVLFWLRQTAKYIPRCRNLWNGRRFSLTSAIWSHMQPWWRSMHGITKRFLNITLRFSHSTSCHIGNLQILRPPWQKYFPTRFQHYPFQYADRQYRRMRTIWCKGPYSRRRHRLIGIGIPIINLRRLSDSPRFIMKIPVRRSLFSE